MEGMEAAMGGGPEAAGGGGHHGHDEAAIPLIPAPLCPTSDPCLAVHLCARHQETKLKAGSEVGGGDGFGEGEK